MKKLAIIGGSPSASQAPYNDDEFELWGLGNQADRHPRIDRLFEIHDNLSEHPAEYPKWLAGLGVPLVVSDKFPIQADHIETYPEAEVDDLFIPDYLTSSPAYMLAYAILQGYEVIHFYGIDMAVDDHEYYKQRPCFEAWCGYAKGLGIELVFPEKCPVLKSKYKEGRDWNNANLGAFNEQALLALAAQHRAKIEQYERLIHTHSGSMQTYERLAKVARAHEAGQEISLSDAVVIQ